MLPCLKAGKQWWQLGCIPEGGFSAESLPEPLLLCLEGRAPLAEEGHFIRLQGGHLLPHGNSHLFNAVPFLRQLLQRRPQCGQTLPHSPEAGRTRMSSSLPQCQALMASFDPSLTWLPGCPLSRRPPTSDSTLSFLPSTSKPVTLALFYIF